MSRDAIAAAHAIPAEYLSGLDPEWVAIWNEHGRHLVRADEVSIEQYRKDPDAYSFKFPIYPGPAVFDIKDFDIPVTSPQGQITIRVYTPEGPGPFPVHLNYHGGGWVLGSLKSEAAWCRHICNETGIMVVDVDYRMGPEHKFPTAIYDSYDALKWVLANTAKLNANPNSVSIGGLSAGGQMSAVMSHFARDDGIDLKLQLLVVPATDLRWLVKPGAIDETIASRYPSVMAYKDVPWGPVGREDWFMKYWVSDTIEGRKEALNKWIASPVLAPSFDRLCPAHIITAEYDFSRDEGEHYGQLLKDAGNEVTIKRYTGMPHAFGHYNCPLRGLSKSREYVKDTCIVLQKAHGLQQSVF